MKKIIVFIAFLIIVSTQAYGATHTVLTTDKTIDGDSYKGSTIAAGDTIIIDTGTHTNTLFRDIHGTAENPVLIKNDTDGKATFINDASQNYFSVLEFRACSYVYVVGDNTEGITYGIYIDDQANPTARADCLCIWERSTHMDFSFIEMTSTNNITQSGIGVRLGPGNELTEDDSVIYDDFKFHDLYIHGTRGEGFYLGMNNPPDKDDPYISNVDVYNCILVDIGATGITLKGSYGGENLIYNNIIIPSDRSSSGSYSTSVVTVENIERKSGIRILDTYGGNTTKIYGNYVEKPKYSGIKFEDNSGGIEAYNNIVVGAGYGWTAADQIHCRHAFRVEWIHTDCSIHDNIAVDCIGYGVWQRYDATGKTTVTDNQFGDMSLGLFGGNGYIAGDIIDGGGNVLEASPIDLDGVTAFTDNWAFNDDCIFISGNPYSCSIGSGGTVQTGLAGGNISEAQLAADGDSGYIITLTVAGDTWVATVCADNAITDALIAGITCTSGVQAAGFAANLAPKITYDDFSRDSDTVITWHVEGDADYDIATNETWQIVIPATALTSGVGATATPDITISAVQASSTSDRVIGYDSGACSIEYGSTGRNIVRQ